MIDREVQINPEMVVLARESRGITQQDLALRIGASQGWLSRVENGVRFMSEDALSKLSEVLEYPPEFFLQEERLQGIDTSTLYHRKRQDVPIKLLNWIHAQINVRRLEIARMLRGVDIGEVRFRSFDISEFMGQPDEVARAVRAYWRVPLGPIPNLIQLIEDAGGIVIPIDFGTTRIDAISQWPTGTPPLFFVNIQSPMDRLRFTLCHELGHIFMHQRPNMEMEEQADRFASQFLMPDMEVRPFLSGLSLRKLAELKPYWKVSMAALIMKAKQLGTITPRQERSLWVQMGPFRTKEPADLDLPMETPSLLQEIVNAYRVDLNYSASEFGKVVYLSEREVKHIYYRDERHLRAVK